MEEILYIPIVAVVLLGTLNAIVDNAQATSDKVIDYTDDMVNAVDCAIAAIPLEVCSPNIYGRNFDQEINDTLNLTQRLEWEFQNT